MEKKFKVYIKGVQGRGNEVIKALTDLGAEKQCFHGSGDPEYLFFINHNHGISCAIIDSEFGQIIMDNYREILLPEINEADAHPQSPWVSVKDRMPSVERDLFGDATRPSLLVLTASHAGDLSFNRWNGREWLYDGDVDYWMPIPAIPKGDNNDE